MSIKLDCLNTSNRMHYKKIFGWIQFTDIVIMRCLISFGKTQSVSQVAQLKKGESSNWINKTGMLPNHFSWPDDFWAVGVSESHVLLVRGYISNQEQHHKHRTFEEEINEFMKKYGWELIKE